MQEQDGDPMSHNWFLLRGGKQFGPIAGLDFEEFVRRGELLQTDLLWHEGASE